MFIASKVVKSNDMRKSPLEDFMFRKKESFFSKYRWNLCVVWFCSFLQQRLVNVVALRLIIILLLELEP